MPSTRGVNHGLLTKQMFSNIAVNYWKEIKLDWSTLFQTRLKCKNTTLETRDTCRLCSHTHNHHSTVHMAWATPPVRSIGGPGFIYNEEQCVLSGFCLSPHAGPSLQVRNRNKHKKRVSWSSCLRNNRTTASQLDIYIATKLLLIQSQILGDHDINIWCYWL